MNAGHHRAKNDLVLLHCMVRVGDAMLGNVQKAMRSCSLLPVLCELGLGHANDLPSAQLIHLSVCNFRKLASDFLFMFCFRDSTQ